MTDRRDFMAKASAAPMLKRYVIERDEPGVGNATAAEVAAMAATSCAAVAPLAPNLQWEHSYRTADKFFCVYLSVDEETIRKHGEMSGFPVDKITLVTSIVDPTLAA